MRACPQCGATAQRASDYLSDSPITLELEQGPPPANASLPTTLISPPFVPFSSAEKPLPAVPDYEVLRMLGRGGMGIVYLARHLKLKRPVALKMLLGDDLADPAMHTRFELEAQTAARMHHPNIVQIYEVGDFQGRPYIAFEFVEGPNLDQHLDGKPIPPEAAARLVEALARGLEVAHRSGVVHRDLKPANVLLALDGTPKIADFGLARRLDDGSRQTYTGAVIGTPSYMAPEQADGLAAEAGPASDIYALGAILYEAITGRPPFRGINPLHTLDLVRHFDLVRPRYWQPNLPRDLETVCLKAMRRDPAVRYASAGDLADDLARFLRGEPVRARPLGWFERFERWLRKPERAREAGVVLLVHAVVRGVVAYFFIASIVHRAGSEEISWDDIEVVVFTAGYFLVLLWAGLRGLKRDALALTGGLMVPLLYFLTRLPLLTSQMARASPTEDPMQQLNLFFFYILLAAVQSLWCAAGLYACAAEARQRQAAASGASNGPG